jgi:transcriptional regulator with XRE-family HTH domain
MTVLAAWMEKAGETDTSVAEKAGVSRVQILRIRHGVSKPSPRLALTLSGITGIPAWEFLRPDN